MSGEHEQHLSRILDKFSAEATAKYRAGQAEHGGQLWTKPGMLGNLKAEAIDLVIYLYTLEEQLAALTAKPND